jgi:serine protease Do
MEKMKQNSKYLMALSMVVLLLASAISGAMAAKNAPVRMIPEDFSSLAEMVSPAVVHIQVEKTMSGGAKMLEPYGQHPFGSDPRFKDFFDPFGRQRPPEFRQPGQGSGFIVDKDGYIVTNNHVVEGADKIKVVLKNEREYPAETVGHDPVTDIAVIKVKVQESLPAVILGNSNELKVGEWVAAIGSPFGLEHTVTAGIVSAKGRVIGSGPYDDFIQTDASINPGNSGGPLINMRGEVVGINTMIIAGGQGIGFAIPIDLAKGIIAQLKSAGEVTRGWIGVSIQDLKGNLAEYYGVEDKSGVLVADVTPGDPADQAGIRAKDIIIEVNGNKVQTSRDVTTLVANLGVGETAQVSVKRDGQLKTFEVKIGKRPLTVAAAGSIRQEKDGEFGFEVADLTPEMAQRFNIQDPGGVIVVAVASASKAEEAGIQRGDLIVEVNRQRVDSVNDFKKLINQSKNDDGIYLLVKRMNAGLVVIHLA